MDVLWYLAALAALLLSVGGLMDAWDLIFALAILLLFMGEPDLHDAIVQWAMGACECSG